MGRQDYSVRAQGMNEGEALRNALDADRIENGHQEGYSGTIGSRTTLNSTCLKPPKPPKKCKVEKLPKLKVKWETRFAVEPYGNSTHIAHEKTKGEAIKKAKELAIRYNCEYGVRMIKQPIIQFGGVADTLVARVTPEKAELGIWKFWGEARC